MFSSIITRSIIVPYEWKNKLTDLDASTKISSLQKILAVIFDHTIMQ